MTRVNRHIDGLLAQRRGRSFPATEDEAEQLRVAIELRAARPGADEPDESFLAALHQRLADATDGAPEPSGARPRRAFVRTAGIAAATAAGAVVVDRLVTAGPAVDETANPPALRPHNGTWRTVLTADLLPEGAVHEFEFDTVAGFVERTPDGLRAVSAICTHQGCRLVLRPAVQQLACPCHNAVFALSGEIVHYRLPVELAPLPRIAVREAGGAVQVYVPV